jgi:NAD-dependent dihydropyrimidine dehydrogenase PreA subunit
MRQLTIDLSRCNGGRNCSHECEEVCATKVFKIGNSKLAAINIHAIYKDQSSFNICDQCGDCIIVCPTDALKRNKLGVVIINKDQCVGCYMCIGFCEKDAFKRNPDWLEPYKCTACSLCVKACPHGALKIVEVPIPVARII